MRIFKCFVTGNTSMPAWVCSEHGEDEMVECHSEDCRGDSCHCTDGWYCCECAIDEM